MAHPNPSLARVIGPWGAVWMGLGSILGTGVFVSLGIVTGVLPALIPAVVFAALLATANGLSSAQLASAYPVSGGTYEYAHTFVHPVAGFAAGWMFLVAKSASAATAALGCAGYLLHAFGLPNTTSIRTAIAVPLVLTLTALVASGVRRSNRANAVVVTFTLATLGAFVLFGGYSVDIALLPERMGMWRWYAALQTPDALFHATALMFVAYTGYGRIATLGEEVHDPARTIPRAIVATLALSMLLYVSVSATALAVVGPEAFAASVESAAAPLEVVARAFRHPEVAWVVAAGAITAMTGVLLNLLLGLSRVLLAMARRREMPERLRHVEERTQSPTCAVWTVGVVITLMVLPGDIQSTWSLSAFTVLLYYGLTNLSALRLPASARLYPRWISVAGLLSCFGLAIFVEPHAWLLGLGLLVLGFLVRAWMIARR